MRSRSTENGRSRGFAAGIKGIGNFIYSYFFFSAILVIKVVTGLGQTKFNQTKFYHFIGAGSSKLTEILTWLAMVGSAIVALCSQGPAFFRLFNAAKQTALQYEEEPLKLSSKIIYRILQPLNFISGIFKSSNFFLFSITFLETITPIVGKGIAQILQRDYEESDDPDYLKSLTSVQLVALSFFIASLCSFIAFEQRKADANVKEIVLKLQRMIAESRFNISKAKLTTLIAFVLSTIPVPMLAYISTKSSLDAIAKIFKTEIPEALSQTLGLTSGLTAIVTNATGRMPSFYRLLNRQNHHGYRAPNLSNKLIFNTFLLGLSLDAAATGASNTMGAGRFFRELDMQNERLVLILASVCGISNAIVNASLMFETGRHNILTPTASAETIVSEPENILVNDESLSSDNESEDSADETTIFIHQQQQQSGHHRFFTTAQSYHPRSQAQNIVRNLSDDENDLRALSWN